MGWRLRGRFGGVRVGQRRTYDLDRELFKDGKSQAGAENRDSLGIMARSHSLASELDSAANTTVYVTRLE